MDNNFDILLHKIHEFRQKFYLNKLLRGLIISLGLALFFFLALFVFFYFTYPSSQVKTVLTSICITITSIVFIKWVLSPLLSYFKIGKVISPEEAAVFIGAQLNNVQDKIVNTIQLHALSNQSNNSIILAGINQKIAELKPIPFTKAINYKENKKFTKWVFIPLSAIVLIGLIAPTILKEGTNNLLKLNQTIAPPAPFQFQLISSLKVTHGDDLTLKINLLGNEIPNDVYFEDENLSMKMEKVNSTSFIHTIEGIQKDTKIRFSGGGYSSREYLIQVRPKPEIAELIVSLKYPSYLKKQDEIRQSVGDLILPEGTITIWSFKFKNTSSLSFQIGNKKHEIPVEKNSTQVMYKVVQDGFYKVTALNTDKSSADSLQNSIQIIKDAHPQILVKEIADSLSNKALYFEGTVTDDYGLSALYFNYQIQSPDGTSKSKRIKISNPPDTDEFAFFHLWNLELSEVKPGDEASYYFEVFDNDGVNGKKSTKSEVFKLKKPNQTEVNSSIYTESEKVHSKMQQAVNLSESLQNESKELSQTLLEKKELSFEDKKAIDALLQKQSSLEKLIKDIQQENEKNTFRKQDNNLLNEELKSKQDQLDKLLNNLLENKNNSLLKQLEKLKEENNKSQSNNVLSDAQAENESLKNELERLLELYKDLELQQALQNSIERIKGLATDQKQLSEKSSLPSPDLNSLVKQQELVNSEFLKIKRELEQIKEKSKDKVTPVNLDQAAFKKIENLQQQSKTALQSGNKQQATKNQKKASQALEALAEKMFEERLQSNSGQNTLNSESLRKLLFKLISTSFEQESIMNRLRTAQSSDLLYTKHAQDQRKIKDNISLIADSLHALSKKVPEIEQTILQELNLINSSIDSSIEELSERRTREALRFQQLSMTSINNLSVMLDEILNQMQDAQQNSSSGGSGENSMENLREMQNSLKEKMERAKQQIERDGNQGTVPKLMSEQFGEMAKEQQLIREALQKLSKEKNGNGTDAGLLNQIINDMKLTENELVNKKLLQESINRQNSVIQRMLEAENAEREQDQDTKRNAKAGTAFPPSYHILLEKFTKEQRSETELLRKLPLNLNDFYKSKVQEYFKKLKNP